MSDKNDDLENDSILYEVLEYLVRKQEPELTVNFIICQPYTLIYSAY